MRDSDEEPGGLLGSVRHAALAPIRAPIRILTSKPAQRAYITSFLFASTSLILFLFALAAYTLFYWSYVPRIGFSRTVHLQFDNVHAAARQGCDVPAAHPWGIVRLGPDLASVQGYDVSVRLRMPRTRENRDTGNFMLDVKMFGPGEKGTGALGMVRDGILGASAETMEQQAVLAHARRPAILTYRSPVVEFVGKVAELHWYLLGWRHEAETLVVGMFEGVQFPKGWRNVPAALKLEVQSQHRMQIYEAKVEFRAQFRGLRWLMYNHRISSAFVFTLGFWTTEMVATGLVWLVLSVFLFPGEEQTVVKKEETSRDREVKAEGEEDEAANGLSDTERTFPTYGGQPPLRYRSPPIKDEDGDDANLVLQAPPIQGVEADDEDEDADFLLDEPGRAGGRSDSGLGTSMESSSGRRDTVRRRRSRLSDQKQ